jgi:membrane protein implicated in regulation of membrane protease activity
VDRPEDTSRRRQPVEAGTAVAAGILVLAPIVALLWVGSYAKPTPKLWGFPFFYWYQFLWVFLAAGCTYAAYQVVQRSRRSGRTGDEDGDER